MGYGMGFKYRVSQYTLKLNDDFYIVFVLSGIILLISFFSITAEYLTPKTTGFGISKMWSTICWPSILTEIVGNWSRFQLIKNQQSCLSV